MAYVSKKPTVYPCDVCGTSIEQNRPGPTKKTCSPECSDGLRAPGRIAARVARRADDDTCFAAGCTEPRHERSDYCAFHRAVAKVRTRLAAHGLTLQQGTAMMQAQGWKCPITGEPINWATAHIDHDHARCPGIKSCGMCVRGILSRGANCALGFLKDRSDHADRAASYLREHEKTWSADARTSHDSP